ncbi:MAG TPA: ABC transporter permease, partial [bacterium]|nr:ABC transporter permease [bacterium]
ITLLSLGEGLKETIMRELRMMGKEILYVFPGEISNIVTMFSGKAQIEKEAIDQVKEVEGVELVVPLNYKAETVRFKGKAKMVLLFSYPRKEAQELFKTDMGWKLKEGEWPNIYKEEEVIVGKLVPEDIFPGLKPGDKIEIGGRKFVVKGVLQSIGSKQEDSMIGLDEKIYKKITGQREGAQFLLVKIKSGLDPERMAQKIKKALTTIQKRKKGQEIQYSVLTNEKAGSIAGSILTVIQVIVFAFASIAIVVGGIGIMNTMFTSVRERTREIGLMKAVGAKDSEILLIFLFEASIMGFLGGILGTFLGIIFAKIIESYGQVHPIFYFKASITPGLILFGFFFSFFVGLISGYFPAKRAATLKPAEALRYFE